MTEPHVVVDRDGAVAIVRLNRPDVRNAITKQVLCLLDDAWNEIESDDGVRAAVLTGSGDAFCAGGDLKSLDADDPDGTFAKRFADDPGLAFRALMRSGPSSKPLVAAAEGPALAGGLTLLLAADIRVGAEGSVYGMPEVGHGIFPGAGMTVRLPRQIPYADAMYLLLTGEPIDVREAHRMGLVTRVTATDEAAAEAVRIATVIANNAPLAVQGVKRAVREALDLTEAEGLAVETEIGAAVLASDDAGEGVRAFREKRKPRFQGR